MRGLSANAETGLLLAVCANVLKESREYQDSSMKESLLADVQSAAEKELLSTPTKKQLSIKPSPYLI